MASVTKRKRENADGSNGDKWVCRWVDPLGTHKSKAFDRKKEADAWRQKVEAAAVAYQQSGGYRDATVREAANAYEAHNDRRLADGQIKRSYLAHVDLVMRVSVLPLLGARQLGEVDGQALAKWYSDLRDQGLSARTAADRLILYSGLWKFAKRNRMARGENPVTEALEHIGRVPKPRIRTLTTGEVDALLKLAATRRPGQRRQTWAIAQIAVNLAAFSGLRIGEILALRLQDIDLDARKVHVRHTMNRWDQLTAPKSRDSVRTVPIPAHVADLLRAWIAEWYRENDRQVVLRPFSDGTQMVRESLSQNSFNIRYWQPLCAASGLTGDGKRSIHFHALRHFAASWWLKNRLPITDASRMLGHADPGVTMRIYSHELMEEEERLAAFDTMSAALRTRGDDAGLRTGQNVLEYQPD